jgi:putative heme-binding domain-containing protein
LERLGPSGDPDEWLALILALRRSADRGPAGRLSAFLSRSTGREIGPDSAAWSEWFSSAHPERAGRLSGGDDVDGAAWARRLGEIDWSIGDARRGREVFRQAQCASCHSGNRAVGPDLTGVAGRFSREDLFAAIVQPSRDIADRYRSILVATKDGNLHQGIVIYDAVDSLILQAGATETVLMSPDDVEERRPSETSLMPSGLLDERSDQEIADLDAYLRSLGSTAAER